MNGHIFTDVIIFECTSVDGDNVVRKKRPNSIQEAEKSVAKAIVLLMTECNCEECAMPCEGESVCTSVLVRKSCIWVFVMNLFWW